MAYHAPAYLKTLIRPRARLEHAWDDWDPYSKLALPQTEVKVALQGVSNRGITAFALACAEWTAFRFEGLVEDPRIGQYLETFWVYSFGVDSAIPPETDQEEWQGPIKGPINLSLMTVLNTVMLAEFGPPAQNGSFAATIAQHVLTQREKFIDWQELVLERLSKFSTRSQSDEEGEPVPREMFDPTYHFEGEGRYALIENAIGRIDFAANPFLRDAV